MNEYIICPQWLGTVLYEDALKIQNEKVNYVFSHRKEFPAEFFLIGLNHPAVITLGVRGSTKEDVFLPFNLKNIPVVKVDRGGQATLHSEGQLVIYPIIDLKKMNIGVKDFINDLLLVTRDFFSYFDLDTHLKLEDQTGLYSKNGKIAFCGLRIKDGISFHGISINISNDLSLFQSIRSCGVSGALLDKLDNYKLEADNKKNPSLEDLFKLWCKLYLERIQKKE